MGASRKQQQKGGRPQRVLGITVLVLPMRLTLPYPFVALPCSRSYKEKGKEMVDTYDTMMNAGAIHILKGV